MKVKKLKTLFKMVEDANKVSSLCGDSEHAYRIYTEITFFNPDSKDDHIYLPIENTAREGHRTSFFTWKQFVKTIDEDYSIEVYNAISNDLEEVVEGTMSADYIIRGNGFFLAFSVIGIKGYLKYDHD